MSTTHPHRSARATGAPPSVSSWASVPRMAGRSAVPELGRSVGARRQLLVLHGDQVKLALDRLVARDSSLQRVGVPRQGALVGAEGLDTPGDPAPREREDQQRDRCAERERDREHHGADADLARGARRGDGRKHGPGARHVQQPEREDGGRRHGGLRVDRHDQSVPPADRALQSADQHGSPRRHEAGAGDQLTRGTSMAKLRCQLPYLRSTTSS